MKKVIMVLIILSVFVFQSCKTFDVMNIPGEYFVVYKEKGNYSQRITLVLNSDSTFSYSDKWFEVNEQCKGKWSWLEKNTILMQCFSEPFPAQISRGYKNVREFKAIVLNQKKIKVNNSVLKRSD